jgi:hypothetical protein
MLECGKVPFGNIVTLTHPSTLKIKRFKTNDLYFIRRDPSQLSYHEDKIKRMLLNIVNCLSLSILSVYVDVNVPHRQKCLEINIFFFF